MIIMMVMMQDDDHDHGKSGGLKEIDWSTCRARRSQKCLK